MSEEQDYVEALKKAREQLVRERRACVRLVTEDPEARAMFNSLQETIMAIDRAIREEKTIQRARRDEEAIEEIRVRNIFVQSFWASQGA
jgi:CHASE3 domain sensor protein